MTAEPGWRIGTWNLDARWTTRHEAALRDANCDVWRLTEVDTRVVLEGYEAARSQSTMQRGQHYAAVLSRAGLAALFAPHPASAAARVLGRTYCSSVLPWPRVPPGEPWVEGTTRDKAAVAIEDIAAGLPVGSVWGGDWNHPITGSDAGFYRGRDLTLGAAERLDLQLPTANLPARTRPASSIDHIAVPREWSVRAEHHPMNNSL